MLEIQGCIITAGVDEAGRGPLAGPVFAAAVILDPQNPIKGLADSKKLNEKERDVLFPMIMRFALAYGVGRAEASEIDEINIFTSVAVSDAARRCGVKNYSALSVS